MGFLTGFGAYGGFPHAKSSGFVHTMYRRCLILLRVYDNSTTSLHKYTHISICPVPSRDHSICVCELKASGSCAGTTCPPRRRGWRDLYLFAEFVQGGWGSPIPAKHRPVSEPFDETTPSSARRTTDMALGQPGILVPSSDAHVPPCAAVT
jgi:hypothetical protein